MGLSSVVDDEDSGLRNGWEEEDNGVEKWLFELHISTDFLVLVKDVLQPDVIESVVVSKHEKDDLAKEANCEPSIENGVGRPYMRNVFQWLGIREVIEVDGG